MKLFLRSLLFLTILLLPAARLLAQDKPDKTDEQLALMFFQDKDYEKAAALYEKLFENKPSPYYYTYLLFSLMEINDYDKAEKIVKKLRKENPKQLKYQVDLGYIQLRSGEASKAERQFQQVLDDLYPDKNQVMEVANAFLIRNQTEYAEKTYLKGRELMKDAYPFYLELADLYDRMGNSQKMIEEYLNFVDFDNTNLKAVENRLQTSLNNDPLNTKNDLFRTALLRRIQKNPSVAVYPELLLWFSIQQKDFATAFTQARALDRRQKEDGERIFDLAKLCTSNKSYDIAIDCYKYLIDKGPEGYYHVYSRIALLNVRYLKIIDAFGSKETELRELEKEYLAAISELGKNDQTVMLLRNLAHLQAFYLNRTDAAKDLLNEIIAMPNLPAADIAQSKMELADILLFTGDVWEATLLYSQVEKANKNDQIGFEAKFRNARLFYYIGEYGWAKAQLDILKAATSKLIANDAMDLSLLIEDNQDEDSTSRALRIYSRADLEEFRNQDDLAVATLDSIPMLYSTHPLFDEVLYKKAEIRIKQGKFPDADSLLGKVYDQYPDDILADNAMFLRAQLNEVQLNDKAKAMELYENLLVKYPGSLFTVEARKRFRELRGDQIN